MKKIVLIALALALVTVGTAFAHKVSLFASETDGKICAEGYTGDGSPTKSCKVLV